VSLDLIARYYDLLFADFEEDLPLWLALTEGVEAPILEVGCGTGRLLLPLGQAGHHLTGLDLSAVALSAAQAKVEAAGLVEQIRLVQADMRHFDLTSNTFALALISLNTFMHCLSLADQLATLRTLHRHLQPAGQLIIDLYYPDPALLAEADGRLYFEAEVTDDLTGHLTQWYWRHDLDLGQQLRHLTYVLDEIDQNGLVRRNQLAFTLRYIYRFELELLLQSAGFSLETIYGNYDLTPFESHSPRMIAVARKP
jgi:SAM-dependent methyltransferase